VDTPQMTQMIDAVAVVTLATALMLPRGLAPKP
jgi:hypothetical protein